MTDSPQRPECFEFALDFLGDPEAAELRAYVEQLEAHATLAEPVANGPTRDELWELWLRLNNELPDRPAAVAEFWDHAQIDARARYGHQLAPPADGGVGELVEWLKAQALAFHRVEDYEYEKKAARAADLLEQRHPAPVPVAPYREVADLVVWLEDHSAECLEIDRPEWSRFIAKAARFLHLYLKAAPVPVPVAERLPELRGMFERILCVARSSGQRPVGNIQLADRLISAVVSCAALPLPAGEVET